MRTYKFEGEFGYLYLDESGDYFINNYDFKCYKLYGNYYFGHNDHSRVLQPYKDVRNEIVNIITKAKLKGSLKKVGGHALVVENI